MQIQTCCTFTPGLLRPVLTSDLRQWPGNASYSSLPTQKKAQIAQWALPPAAHCTLQELIRPVLLLHTTVLPCILAPGASGCGTRVASLPNLVALPSDPVNDHIPHCTPGGRQVALAGASFVAWPPVATLRLLEWGEGAQRASFRPLDYLCHLTTEDCPGEGGGQGF